ncbi:heterokaryon incompatibility protein-domain-containing protein [Xylariales sp. PMI_506]|nr:heterokaryon incompatibility protein-domain-containing protein [Xylariales sp. PMI_506]
MDSIIDVQRIDNGEEVSIRVKRAQALEISPHCPECPYIEIPIPNDVTEVIEVKLITVSRDQGWASDPNGGSWTWFDALIMPSSSNMSGKYSYKQSYWKAEKTHREWYNEHFLKFSSRRSIHYNRLGNPNYHRYETTWNSTTSDSIYMSWLSFLNGGDTIQVIPRAMYAGWVNHIQEAAIELIGRRRKLPLALLPMKQLDQEKLYRPLDSSSMEIRLLHLHPGSSDDDITCTLSKTAFSKDKYELFEALSYCWGSQSDRRTINLQLLEDFGGTNGVAVECLITLRQESGKPRVLWVDAVCINQHDFQERSQQVALMRLIFSKAIRVRVWLGEGIEIAAVVFHHIQRFRDAFANDRQRFLSNLHPSDPHTLAIKENDDSGSWFHLHSGHIFATPWFGRVWVVQEVYTAQEVIAHWGSLTFPWALLLQVNQYLERTKAKSPEYSHMTMTKAMSSIFDVKLPRGRIYLSKEEGFRFVGSLGRRYRARLCRPVGQDICSGISRDGTQWQGRALRHTPRLQQVVQGCFCGCH